MSDQINQTTTSTRTEQGMPWRTQPEIDQERQQFLAERRAIIPDIEKGIYPFNGITLCRADVEWLLASDGTSEPINGSSEEERAGLDVRGANLSGVDLSFLPLARLHGGLSMPELNQAHIRHTRDLAGMEQALNVAAVHLEGANLWDTDLKSAILDGAHLESAILLNTHLEKASMSFAHLEGARLLGTHLEGTMLGLAHLERCQAPGAHLEGAMLFNLRAAQADFFEARLEGADCNGSNFTGARFVRASLHGVNLRATRLEAAVLDEAHLEGKEVSAEEVALLRSWRPNFPFVLPPVDLRGAILNSETSLVRCIVGDEKFGGVSLADARVSDSNLAVVDWTYTKKRFLWRHFQAFELGDDREARKPTNRENKPKSADEWIAGYKDAVRANRQLATALRSQGLNEDADEYSCKAQRLQREVLWRQRHYGRAFGSWLLDLVSGYGYKPWRSVVTYLLVVFGFAVVYYLLGNNVRPALDVHASIVFSLTSFHGRGFAPGGSLSPDNPLTTLAAIEAVVGLLIEITFIATFTQRFFAR